MFLLYYRYCCFDRAPGARLGTMIMDALMNHYKEFGPKDGYLTLIADGNAKFLYKKFGFEETAPYAVGMKYKNSF